MYRRALAASWAVQQGELPPDECIEDIFSGGDGWKNESDSATIVTNGMVDSASGSGEDLTQYNKAARPHHHRTASDRSVGSKMTLAGNDSATDLRYKHARNRYEPVGGTGISSNSLERGRKGYVRTAPEVSEFDARPDLAAWVLPSHRNVTV